MITVNEVQDDGTGKEEEKIGGLYPQVIYGLPTPVGYIPHGAQNKENRKEVRVLVFRLPPQAAILIGEL